MNSSAHHHKKYYGLLPTILVVVRDTDCSFICLIANVSACPYSLHCAVRIVASQIIAIIIKTSSFMSYSRTVRRAKPFRADYFTVY